VVFHQSARPRTIPEGGCSGVQRFNVIFVTNARLPEGWAGLRGILKQEGFFFSLSKKLSRWLRSALLSTAAAVTHGFARRRALRRGVGDFILHYGNLGQVHHLR